MPPALALRFAAQLHHIQHISITDRSSRTCRMLGSACEFYYTPLACTLACCRKACVGCHMHSAASGAIKSPNVTQAAACMFAVGQARWQSMAQADAVRPEVAVSACCRVSFGLTFGAVVANCQHHTPSACMRTSSQTRDNKGFVSIKSCGGC